MSRVSQKSQLSPSITKGSNAIDLGKNSGVDMGRKAQPSITSGGIGITQEVANVGGLSVSAGGNVDITPLDFGISVNPSEGIVSVATGAEIPGGLLGISGGIEIDTNTGQVIGGSIGGEALGLGINVSNSQKGGLGVEFTVQIPGTPIELSIGFGFPPQPTEPTPIPAPYITPPFSPEVENLIQPYIPIYPPYPDPANPPPFPPAPPKPPALPVSDKNKICKMVVVFNWGGHARKWNLHGERQAGEGRTYRGFADVKYDDNGKLTGGAASWINTYYWEYDSRTYNGVSPTPINRRYDDTPPMRAVSLGDFPWNSSVYPYDTTKRPFISRQLASYEVMEYWGLQYSIYAHLEERSYVRDAVPKTYETSSAVWWFWFSKSAHYQTYSIQAHWCGKKPELIKPSPFPNLPPRRQNRMDACCRENLKLLRLIYTQLGLSKFPGQLPATIIQEIAKEGEEPAEPPQVPIPTLVDFLMWQFERDDERWGQWEIQINIKDADLTKEGNQGKSVKFPNLAESVAEMEGQMLSIQANVEALVALSIRNLSESGMARQEAIKGYLASMAIAKYMAFPYKEFDVEIPSTYTPGATSIDKLIVESIIHTKGIDYEDKETQRDLLLDLLQAAAITRAVHWRQVDPKSDVKKQILSQLKGSADLSERITNVKAVAADGDTPQKKESWEDKLDAIENGFGFSTGIEDANTPYGRDRERRPRIRQIGDNIAQAGKDE